MHHSGYGRPLFFPDAWDEQHIRVDVEVILGILLQNRRRERTECFAMLCVAVKRVFVFGAKRS